MLWMTLTGVMAVLVALVQAWAFRNLPRARWQVAAALPVRPTADGGWQGRNLTWYGLLAATAYAAGSLLFVFLLGSLGVEPREAGLLGAAILALGIPASRLMNVLVEGKKEGFTVGGAVFVGGLAAPWLIAAARRWGGLNADPAAVLAALALAYALGEGLGRLACISFGCCYGRPAADLPEPFRRWRFVFTGPTKKAAYAGGREGVPLFAVQGVTAVLYSGAALLGLLLFGAGYFRAAGLLALGVTCLWRAVSEPLRADHHGRPREWIAYAAMALLTFVYGAAFFGAWQPVAAAGLPSARAGLAALAGPGVFPALAAIWVIVVIRMGLSTVTASTIRLSLRE